ncbi:MAG: hypothetical protein ABWZ87_04260 [Aeromicrobium sp.]
METLDELSIILGGMLAGLAPGACVLALPFAPNRRLLVVTLTVAALTWLLWLAQWVVWLFAFDEPIPGETVPNAQFPVSNALMHASSVGCLMLIALTAIVVTRRRSAPARHP